VIEFAGLGRRGAFQEKVLEPAAVPNGSVPVRDFIRLRSVGCDEDM